MLKHLEKRRQKNEEEGFTLIELMVVVLIMGILMAIAIPTFLSTRGAANDASAKSDATNAFTNEKAYYSSNLQFLDTTTNADNGPSLDSTLPWGNPTTAGSEAVAAYVSSVTPGTNNAVLIAASSKSGHCFYIADVEQANSSIVGYYATTQACSSSTPLPTSAPAQGTSSGVSSTAVTATTWDASW